MFVGDGSGWRFGDDGPVLDRREHLSPGRDLRRLERAPLRRRHARLHRAECDDGVERGRERDALRRLLDRPRPVLARHPRRRELLPGRPHPKPGAGALQPRYERQPGDLRRDGNRHHHHRHRACEYGAAGGVGCGPAGADVDCVHGYAGRGRRRSPTPTSGSVVARVASISALRRRAPIWSLPPTSAPRCVRPSPPATRPAPARRTRPRPPWWSRAVRTRSPSASAPAATTATPRSSATSPAATHRPALRTRAPATTSSPPADDSRSASSASWTRSSASTPHRSPTTPRSPRSSFDCTCSTRPTQTIAPSSASGTTPPTGRSTEPTGPSIPATTRLQAQTSPPSPSTPPPSSHSARWETSPSPATRHSDSESTAANPAATTSSKWPPSNTPAPQNHNSSSPTPSPEAPPRLRIRRRRWCRVWPSRGRR